VAVPPALARDPNRLRGRAQKDLVLRVPQKVRVRCSQRRGGAVVADVRGVLRALPWRVRGDAREHLRERGGGVLG
jgi:hypothetical protein